MPIKPTSTVWLEIRQQLADTSDPDERYSLVLRMRELALPEDWWAVQNLLWDTGLRLGAGKPLAELLGFA